MPDKTLDVQVAVLGGGPGGYAAAFHAAEMGMNVAMINEDEHPGGVCLHRGCIPSKALLHVAKVVHEARDAKDWGITFPEPSLDLARLRAWKNGVVDKLARGLTELGRRRGVKLLHARGTFADSRTIRLDWRGQKDPDQPQTVRFEHCILAAGSLPAVPAALHLADPRVMDSTGALALADVPKRLLVIGGGYIGLETGTFYAALGSAVTVVELTSGLLPGADRDLVRILQSHISKHFAAIHLDTTVEKLEARKNGIAVTLAGANIKKPVQVFDRVLVSVGRRPNSTGLGLENTKVETDERGYVRVDRQMRTADEHILAIGDVAGEPLLAHKASREAKVAVEVIAGKASRFDNVAIPAVVFTDPEIAWCGLTETDARTQDREVHVARFPWAASGRAVALGRPEGLTKILFDPETERVLGVGIVGAGAGELIAEGVLAVEMAAVAHDLAATIHAHPTLSETIGEAAEAFFGAATHVYHPKH